MILFFLTNRFSYSYSYSHSYFYFYFYFYFIFYFTSEQCLNIFKTPSVQRRRVETYKQSLESSDGTANSDDTTAKFSQPAVHAMVYDPSNGKLKKLPVDFKAYMSKYSDVFNLYDIGR